MLEPILIDEGQSQTPPESEKADEKAAEETNEEIAEKESETELIKDQGNQEDGN